MKWHELLIAIPVWLAGMWALYKIRKKTWDNQHKRIHRDGIKEKRDLKNRSYAG
jgi:hypothetical protein